MTLTNRKNSNKSATKTVARGVLAATALSVVSLVLLSSGSFAADCEYPEVCVQPVTLEPTTAVSPQAPVPQAPTQPAVQQPSQLPVTGSDVGMIAAGGLLMLGAGIVLTKRSGSSSATS